MRKFKEIRVYDEDDYFEARLVDEDGKVILKGDWYHDKIDEKISGFFAALDYLEEPYERDSVFLDVEIDE